MTIATGGKSIYGACIGILMLEARFPRIPGDMGNASTWPFPVLYRIVRDASPDLVVRKGAAGLKDAFIAAGKELVDEGADGITTNCGFLSVFQDDMAAALGVPVAMSSLMQVPLVESMLPPGKHVTILTVSSATLSKNHLKGAGVDPKTPVVGTDPNGEFTSKILDNQLELNVDRARADNVSAARQLVADYPDTGAIVLECTNMIPYAADIRRASGLPVFTAYSHLCWFQSSLAPPRFPDP